MLIESGDIPLREEWDPKKKIGTLWHGTSTKRIEGILKDGFEAGSCWGTEAVARYFARQESQLSGGRQTLIAVDLDRFDPTKLHADDAMAEFPIFRDYDDLQIIWEDILEEGRDPDWQDSLRIYQSVVLSVPFRISLADVVGRGPRAVSSTISASEIPDARALRI